MLQVAKLLCINCGTSMAASAASLRLFVAKMLLRQFLATRPVAKVKDNADLCGGLIKILVSLAI
jgi:hypothetical protein